MHNFNKPLGSVAWPFILQNDWNRPLCLILHLLQHPLQFFHQSSSTTMPIKAAAHIAMKHSFACIYIGRTSFISQFSIGLTLHSFHSCVVSDKKGRRNIMRNTDTSFALCLVICSLKAEKRSFFFRKISIGGESAFNFSVCKSSSISWVPLKLPVYPQEGAHWFPFWVQYRITFWILWIVFLSLWYFLASLCLCSPLTTFVSTSGEGQCHRSRRWSELRLRLQQRHPPPRRGGRSVRAARRG